MIGPKNKAGKNDIPDKIKTKVMHMIQNVTPET
jgi:hypothetical protein